MHHVPAGERFGRVVRGAGHAERLQQPLADLPPPGLAGDPLGHRAEQPVGEVRVVVLLAGLRDELDVLHRGDQLVDGRTLACDPHLARLALQAREVGEHPPDRRRPVRDPVQVLLEPVVEIELARVAELHDRGRSECLRDRPDAVLRIRRRVAVVRVARSADRSRPHDLAVAHGRARDRRQAVGLPLMKDPVERTGGLVRRGQAPRARAAPRRGRAPRRRRRCRGA